MKMFFSSLMLILSFNMISLNHPLSLGLMILIQTLILCFIMGMIIKTYWFSYILFLTFLGGLLVLFIYVSSVASNEMFKMSLNFKLNWMLSTLLIILTMTVIKINHMELNWLNFSNNMMDNDNFLTTYLNYNKINLNKLYNNQTYILMMMLIIYLFISLVAIVKITNIFYGPLRKN